jgi:hypothetical protein
LKLDLVEVHRAHSVEKVHQHYDPTSSYSELAEAGF